MSSSLARWSMVAAVALVGVALVVTAWTTRASVVAASDTLVRGQLDGALQAVRADLGELDGPPSDADLAAVLEAHRADGVRYLALVDGERRVVAAAGTSDPTRARRDLGPPRRGWGGRRDRDRDRDRRAARVVIEVEPLQAEALATSATRTLGAGIAVAIALLVFATVLVRRTLAREAADRAAERDRERDRRLASLGEMSAVLAHEIRNPLASLKGNAQLLAGMLPAGERPRAKAERVVDEAVRLETLTNDLLAFVRTGELHRAPVDPTAILRDAIAAVALPEAARALPEPIAIDTRAAPATWSLDAGRIRQVLTNLLDNAVSAGPPARAAITTVGDRLIFEITDRGPGIPAADRPHLFEPFFTRKTQGTGLGLAVAERVVALHGGAIQVDDAPGGGARFRVLLPRGDS